MRLFIGIKITANEEIKKVLDELKEYDCLKTVEEENLHINLKFLGEVSEEKVEGIKKVLDELKGFGEFKIEIKNIGCFPNKKFIRVIWIGTYSEKLINLAKLIDSELETLGFHKEEKYMPHITLARVKRKPPDEIKNLFGEKNFGIQNVDEISLIKSILKKEGPEYEDVYTVKLGD